MTRILPDTIKIKTRRREAGKEIHETEEVPAKVVGLLAFREDGMRYRRGRKSTQQYSITHIPSGLRVASELSLPEARRAIRALQEIDWSNPAFTDDAGYAAAPDVYKATAEKVRATMIEVRG